MLEAELRSHSAWRTDDDTNASCATVTPVTDRDLTNETYLKQWIARAKNHEMARLGAGGPSLTSASFRAGIDELTATLGDNTERLLDAEKAKSVKTFSGKHGDALSQRLMNCLALRISSFCIVTRFKRSQ